MDDTVPRRISLHQPISSRRSSLDTSLHSLHKPLSHRSLIDSIPKTPNRLPSPNGKTGRRVSTSPVSNKSRSSGASSRISRRSSLDALPLVPSRFLSPETKEGLVVEMSDQAMEALKMCPFPEKENKLKAAARDTNHHSPLAPTESSSSSSDSGDGAVSEADSRLAILSRLPEHIKGQLSLEDWYKILEPTTMLTGAECASVKSDISDELPSFVPPPATSDQVNDEQEESGGSNRWMESHISAYENTISCTEDDEGKQQECAEEDASRQGPPVVEEPEVAQESEVEQESTSPQKQKKRVSFGKANVRYHERVLVVHPSTSSGPSVGIGWDYTESEEAIAWNNQTSEEMRLTRRDREEIINELGYSQRDVAKAIRECLKIKNQRRRTVNNLQGAVVNVEKVESIAENAQRKIRKLHKKFRMRREA